MSLLTTDLKIVDFCNNATLCFFSDSADKVVQGEGKFEEIVVASNEITASTVQLVSETCEIGLHKVDVQSRLPSGSHNRAGFQINCVLQLMK